jgi:hypothetical protein
MRPPTLCLERLLRIQGVLNRAGGEMSVRNLRRSFAIWPWEVEQAAALGWLKLNVQGGRGRRSRIVELVAQDRLAHLPLPPARDQIPREISKRHQLFAMRAARECVPRGVKALGFRGIVAAYVRTYNPRSYAGARASASRLMGHPHVRAAMQWSYAQMSDELPREEPMPTTAKGIWLRLHELGNWRVRSANRASRRLRGS